ncbi:MAG: hypothetical protein WC565_07940 [Parcubacteria group bacterium]|jgi:hypothetical protein
MNALQGFEWLAYLSFFAAAWLRTFRLIDGAQALGCVALAALALLVRGLVELNKGIEAGKKAEQERLRLESYLAQSRDIQNITNVMMDTKEGKRSNGL